MIAPAETEGTSPEQRLMFAWRLMFTGRSSNAQLVPMMGGEKMGEVNGVSGCEVPLDRWCM